MAYRVALLVLGLLGISAIPSSNSVVAAPVQKSYSLAAGAAHTCRLTLAYPQLDVPPLGTMACWGWNGDGQLGDGTLIDRHQPVQVQGVPTSVAGVTAGAAHTCAITWGGTVYCWGSKNHGQLGNNSTVDSAVPLVVALPAPAIHVAAGFYFTCAVLKTHQLYCWGHNEYGQAGGGELNLLTPQLRFEINNVKAVAGGFGHGCLILTDGTVKCWGLNDQVQLGDHTLGGVEIDLADPIDADLTVVVTRLSLGNRSSCALRTDQVVECWGSQANANGTTNIYRLSAGSEHACVARDARTTNVYCWGHNDEGQLGNGTFQDSAALVLVQGIGAVAALATGHHHSCVMTPGGVRWCWGDNSHGQLGDGTTIDSPTPVH